MNKKFVRSKNRKIGGVCAGIAEYLNMDPVIVRAVFLCMLFLGGSGFVFYIILLFIMPENDGNFTDYVEVNDQGKEMKSEGNPNGNNIKEEKPIVEKALHRGSLFFGLLLIFLGVYFFLRNFFPCIRVEYWLPLVLVGIGLFLIVFSKKPKKE